MYNEAKSQTHNKCLQDEEIEYELKYVVKELKISVVFFHPFEIFVFFGTEEGFVYMFDYVYTNNLLSLLVNENTFVNEIELINNDILLVLYNNKELIFWDFKNNKKLRTIGFKQLILQSIPLDHDKFVVTTERKCISIQLQNDQFKLSKIVLEEDIGNAVFVSKTCDHGILAIGTSLGYVVLYNIYLMKNIQIIKFDSQNRCFVIDILTSITYADRMFVLCDNGIITLLQKTNKKYEIANTYRDPEETFKFTNIQSKNNILFAGVKNSHYIFVFDIETSELLDVLQGPNTGQDHIKLKENTLISLSDKGDAYIWKNIKGQKIHNVMKNFVEIKESVNYVEKESEFDLPNQQKNSLLENGDVVDLFPVLENPDSLIEDIVPKISYDETESIDIEDPYKSTIKDSILKETEHHQLTISFENI